MSNQVVLVEKKDRVSTLTLNRPEKKNALNLEMIGALQAEVDRISGSEEVRVLIIQGAGDAFCSGVDKSFLLEDRSASFWLDLMRRVGRLIRSLREMPQPIITKLRGVAYGAGANLALAGDFVLAADNARFRENFIHLGLVLGAGGTYFLPRLVGMAKARELAMLGEEIDGRTAAAIGLAYKSVSDEVLDLEVTDLAAGLIAKPFTALALIKTGLEKSLDESLDQILDWEAAHQAVMLQTPTHKEAVQRFLGRRHQVK